jgi:hypothetical protein
MKYQPTIRADEEVSPSSAPLSLREIASWHDIPEISEKPDIRASVPILQRGLVWNPAQIELLWDSLLRGFPIGALVLSAKITDQTKETDSEKLGVTHHLLDGQQRCDAISLGFKNPFLHPIADRDTKQTESILWLDLDPDDNPWSTREFVVRLTTPSHPWGYHRNDSADPLNAGAIREALKTIGVDPAADNYQRPSPAQLFPHDANAPVPLAWLLLSVKERDFWEAISGNLARSVNQAWHSRLRKFLDDGESDGQRTRILQAIQRIESTKIIALCAPADLLVGSRQEAASAPERENISNIEHLFQRLNQQGTRLDGEELAYSMVKAYWPDLAGPIDKIAKQLPATRLISLGIRAALSNEERNKLPNGLSVSGIRAMARKDDEKTSRVYRYIKDQLGHGCGQIANWLRYHPNQNPSGLLPVHIGSIAYDAPDIFLLLLTFANRPVSDWEQSDTEWPKRLQALVTLIHWFGRNKGSVANRVFAACVHQISLANISGALGDALKAGDLRPIHSPAALEMFLHDEFPEAPEDTRFKEWRWWSHLMIGETDGAKERRKGQWEEFLWFKGQREMLLYAQRDYINRRFHDYDPARKDFWRGHNRPWDFDHILASTYLYWQQGDFKPVCDEWVGTIGNLRAWPFEDNRSEQRQSAIDKLGKYPEKQRQSFVTPDELDGFSGQDAVKFDAVAAYAFVTVCRKRLLRIYGEWYHSVGIAELIRYQDISAT